MLKKPARRQQSFVQAKITLDLHLDPETDLEGSTSLAPSDTGGSTAHAPSVTGGSTSHAPSAALTEMQQPLLDTTGTTAAAVTATDTAAAALPAGPP